MDLTTGHIFPQIAESYRVPTSNKERKVICEIDGWVLGGVQFGMLAQVLFWGPWCRPGVVLRE